MLFKQSISTITTQQWKWGNVGVANGSPIGLNSKTHVHTM